MSEVATQLLAEIKTGRNEAAHLIYVTKLPRELVYGALVWLEARGLARVRCDHDHVVRWVAV